MDNHFCHFSVIKNQNDEWFDPALQASIIMASVAQAFNFLDGPTFASNPSAAEFDIPANVDSFLLPPAHMLHQVRLHS